MRRLHPWLLLLLLAPGLPARAQQIDPDELATDEEYAEALERFRKDFSVPEPQDRADAISYFSFTPHPKTFELLGRLTRDKDPIVAGAALEGLLNQPFGPQIQRKILSDLDFFKRKHMKEHLALAASHAGGVEDPAAVKALLGLLHYPDYDVVKAALRSIGRIGDKGVVSRLIVFLETVFPNLDERNHHPPTFNWERFEALKSDVIDAMKSLTGERFEDEEDWRKWFNENRREYPNKY